MKTNKHRANGFTIVELLISVVVIGILISVSIIAYNGVQNNARRVAVLSDLDNASSVLEHDLQKTGTYPATIESADNGKGLESSEGTNLQYSANNVGSTKIFCLSATSGAETYNINQEGKASVGYCPVLRYDGSVITSYPGTGTVVSDIGTSGMNATIVGSVSVATAGSFQTTNNTDRIESNITVAYGNNTTWSAWINCAQNASTINMFMGRHVPYFGFYAGNSFYYSNYISGIQRSIRSTPTNLQLNTWYHGVFTTEYNGVDTTMKIYINGAKNVSAAYPGSQYNTSYKFVVGDAHASAWYPFKGMVSDVRIYNYTMSDEEIKRLFEEQRSRYGV